MKREIKYRVWDHKHQEMVNSVSIIHCDLLNKTDIRYRVDRTWTLIGAYDNRVELMQYTGIKDKHGVDIFEGDIIIAQTVEKHSYWGDFDHITALQGVITYYDNSFCLLNDNVYNHLWTNAEEYIVLGNIFENPELLEECDDEK